MKEKTERECVCILQNLFKHGTEEMNGLCVLCVQRQLPVTRFPRGTGINVGPRTCVEDIKSSLAPTRSLLCIMDPGLI